MREETFIVHYLSVRNCYLYFPEHWASHLNDFNASSSALRVNYNGKCAYFSWSPHFLSSHDISIVRLNATYAQKLGIKDGEKVLITLQKHIPSVSRVFMTPVSSPDFEILAMNQDLLQSGLLDQIQIVWPGQTLTAWVGTSMYAVLFVDSAEPICKVGRLQLMTEIIVNPPADSISGSEDQKTELLEGKGVGNSGSDEKIRNEDSCVQKRTSVVSFIWDSVQGISSRFWGKEGYEKEIGARSEQIVANILSDKLQVLEPLVLRVHPFQFSDHSKVFYQFLQPYNAYIHKTNVLLPLLYKRTNLLVKLIPVSLVSKTNSSANDEEKKSEEKDKQSPLDSTSIYVKLCIIEEIVEEMEDEMKDEISTVFKNSRQRCIFLSSTVRSALHLKIGCRVRLEFEGDVCQNLPVSVELTSIGVGDAPKDLESSWRNYFANLCGEGSMLLNSNSLVPILSSTGSVQHVLLKIVDPPTPYCLFTKETFEKIKVKMSSSKNLSVPISHSEDEVNTYREDYHCFSHVEKLISHCVASIEITLGLTYASWPPRNSIISVSNVLIRGKPGAGGSSLARYLGKKFREPPNFVHVVEIQCRSIKGKKVENLHKLLSQALAECSLHQPSILILQDLDILTPVCNDEQDAAQENRYYARVGEMIAELLEDYQPAFKIAVVATSKSTKLNSTLMAPRGQHTFHTVLDIPDLTKDDRLKLLEKLVEKKVSLKKFQLDLNFYAQKSDGYVVQDLLDFMEKAVFEAWKRKALSGDFCLKEPALHNEDLEKAFQLTQPLALRGVELVQDAGHTWSDIGGLEKAKKLLVEMLEWPVQYPELFSQAPLRLQSGVLLYGAPGTGKTLLASAVAKECGLNFISVKGPELLSKYIGASEEAVRTVFQKAQSAKPCVLFFDEFDSLAPRRGHDSTGVTDRVVNQLLTQLDGVEALNSVWVLAATSRPDLLDPALLRPGRLDRAIQCPLPTEDDRLAILQSLSRKVILEEDVDLKCLAKNAVGFTGADLQAVLYSAQLAAVEELLPLKSAVGDDVSLSEDGSEMETSHCKSENSKGPIKVSHAHLLAALKDTRPSLSVKEKEKYDAIYASFERSQPGSSKGVKTVAPLEQKVTLA